MSDQKSNRDHISRLPPELLDDIFHHAHDSYQPLTTPLSKTLLPFQRRQLFRSIKVTSYKSFENLCRTARNDSRIPSLVRYFKIEFDFDGSTSPVQEAEDPISPSNSVVEHFLRRSSNVQLVRISGSTRIALLLLSPSVTSALPKLESLDISSTLHSLPDPFDPSTYAGLQSCTRLNLMTLTLYRSSASIVHSAQTQFDSTSFGTRIKQITLIGPISSGAPSLRQFFSSFNSLSILSLYDTSDNSSLIHDLLEALPAPHKLDVLALGLRCQRGFATGGGFSKSFKTLTRLEALSISSDFSPFTPDLYSNLRALPIDLLSFASTAQVSISQLTALISGPTKHPTLKSIGLNQIKGRIGTRIEDIGEPYWHDEEMMWIPYLDWTLPRWTDECEEDQLVEFLESAKLVNVEVTGSAVDAIGITAMRDKEWRLASGYRVEQEDEEGDDKEETE
ncbi:hypothetical protein JCM5353_008433 [Sporobolomyces roseus]